MEMRTVPEQEAGVPLHDSMQSSFMGSSHIKSPSDEVPPSPPGPAAAGCLDLGALSIGGPTDVAADMASSSPDARLSQYSMTTEQQVRHVAQS